jgi:membrane associated rhomboid family serine protease
MVAGSGQTLYEAGTSLNWLTGYGNWLESAMLPTHLLAATRYSREVITDWRPRFMLLRDILLVVWGLNLVNWILLGGALRQLCIPRRTIGLIAVPITPLVHGDPDHLLGNSLYFFVFGWLVSLRGIPDFLIVTIVIALVDSLGTWLLAEPVPNYGASGIVYGYFSFLLFSSFFDRDVISLLLAIVVFVLDRAMLRRLFVDRPGVSLEGHMFGFFGGILAILLLPALRTTF